MYVLDSEPEARDHTLTYGLILLVHASKDRILLDGEDVYSDDEGDEEEVFALKGLSEDSDEEEEREGSAEHDDEDNAEGERSKSQSSKATKSKPPKGKPKKNAPSSDEESQSEEEEEGWGRKKSAYYASNADELESGDEEANEMEEQEARRLQAKAREVMTDEDFGLGDLLETGTAENERCALSHPTLIPHRNSNGLVEIWTSRLLRCNFSHCLRISKVCCGIFRRRTPRPLHSPVIGTALPGRW